MDRAPATRAPATRWLQPPRLLEPLPPGRPPWPPEPASPAPPARPGPLVEDTLDLLGPVRLAMRSLWRFGQGRRARPGPALVLPRDVPSALALHKVEALRAAGCPLEPDIRAAWERAVRLHRAAYGHLQGYRPPPAWEELGPLE